MAPTKLTTTLPTREELTPLKLYEGLIFAALIMRDYNQYVDVNELKQRAKDLAKIFNE